ncbi:hypothetical protein [Anaerotruncus colihominis]|uniref:hypothetical protein n=1 Tax=Anaerotruncus colihominis TaxID=169435 RepID=UPI00138F32F0|nr:hypothetical protein [Anaerotruncus colihominis]MCI8491713.1 hypothetical protein [Anaerotruncus sp.]MCR2025948.1 hypothetical protein [Anaerotruncus colihominis]
MMDGALKERNITVSEKEPAWAGSFFLYMPIYQKLRAVSTRRRTAGGFIYRIKACRPL